MGSQNSIIIYHQKGGQWGFDKLFCFEGFNKTKKLQGVHKNIYYLKGIKATSSVPDLNPSLHPTMFAYLKQMATKSRVKNVHTQDSGEKSFMRFQNFDVSCGYLVHQYKGRNTVVGGK